MASDPSSNSSTSSGSFNELCEHIDHRNQSPCVASPLDQPTPLTSCGFEDADDLDDTILESLRFPGISWGDVCAAEPDLDLQTPFQSWVFDGEDFDASLELPPPGMPLADENTAEKVDLSTIENEQFRNLDQNPELAHSDCTNKTRETTFKKIALFFLVSTRLAQFKTLIRSGNVKLDTRSDQNDENERPCSVRICISSVKDHIRGNAKDKETLSWMKRTYISVKGLRYNRSVKSLSVSHGEEKSCTPSGGRIRRSRSIFSLFGID